MNFLSRDDLIKINKKYDTGTVFNHAAVDMATGQIKEKIFGTDVLPTMAAKAAYLARAIARHHMFKDGNKRTALEAVSKFLGKNGYQPTQEHINGGGARSSEYSISEWIDKIVDARDEDALDVIVGNFSTWLRVYITHESRH